MRRKVVKHGSNTLTVSLPSKWAKLQGIKSGDEIDIHEQENSLIVNSTETTAKSKKIEIEIATADQFRKRLILKPYLCGYDEIKITYQEKGVIDKIYSSLPMVTLGSEIIEQGKNYCVIKNVSEVSTEEIEQMMNRLMLFVIDVFNDLIESIRKNDFETINNLSSMWMMVYKLSFFCIRNINKKKYIKKDNLSYYPTIIMLFEGIGDTLRQICFFITEQKPKLSEETIKIMNDILLNLRDHYKLFHKYDQAKLIQTEKKRKLLEKSCMDKQLKSQPKEAVVISYLYGVLLSIKNISLWVN